MDKRIYMAILCLGLLALGLFAGYSYGVRSVNLERYDKFLFELNSSILMMDALRFKEYDVLGTHLAARIEGGMSGMVLLYDKHKFNEWERLRCAVTRKARVLYENKKILASREKLDDLDYPYDQVKAYLESNCEGKPSHDNWTAVNKPTKEKK